MPDSIDAVVDDGKMHFDGIPATADADGLALGVIRAAQVQGEVGVFEKGFF